MAGLEHVVRKLLALVGIVAVLVTANATVARTASLESPNDTARFLAGLPPALNSPLAAATRDQGWQSHSAEMNVAWAAIEKRLLMRIRVWSAAKLAAPRATMFYMFGGPDFIHADAFFPNASVYVLSGLEPIGPLPNVPAPPSEDLAAALGSLRLSLNNFLQFGYFITSEMGTQFKSGTFTGILPVLYMFLARSDKTISQVELVTLNGSGEAVPVRGKRKPTGVRISFSSADGRPRRLYYFRTDLSDAGVGKSGFLKFCARLGQGDSLLKSASYLLHLESFSNVRKFLLKHSAVIVQDDSGVPLKYLVPGNWRLRPFGQYVGPTDEFKRHYQPELAQLFRSGGAQPVNFGIGYRWHPQRTNILIADRLTAPGVRPQ